MVLGVNVSEVADVSAAGMIIPLGPLKAMVATKPVDFRKGAVGLAALVEHELAGKPFSGVSCVFRAKLANRIKLLVWDGSGLALVSTVLQTGAFHWPRAGDGVMRLSAAQMSALFEGAPMEPDACAVYPEADRRAAGRAPESASRTGRYRRCEIYQKWRMDVGSD
ncbi:transposase [Sphingomonas populi]|uniref:Transposase n=1 Tax=Sphingomonas populi TaxID=2484750 RepID=A0A4Q6XGN1_9SPHN|nr:IS66 family insertion sequence element accessory protein TnpB [Sphingomonas populi]RZF58653.1 transposase [Sphingomonas populi]